MRGLLRSLAALVAGLGLLVGSAAAATPVPPLATSGGRIVDADGRTTVLQGVNWFGFETSAHVVHGLWARDYRDVLAQIHAAGFNTIRLPFSLAALDAPTTTGIDFAAGRNAPLRGRTPLQALDTIIDAAARENLLVLLDNHSAADDSYQQPLWYGDGGYTEDDWVAAWRRLAARYAGRPNVIGADLKNEPHGPATWGTGGPTDWRRAAERAGRAISGLAPNWLIVVEGIEGHVAGQRLAGHWWGGNLEGARRAPVRLPRPHRLVYSPHEYGPGVFPQPWFRARRPAAVLERRWDTGFGYLVRQGIAPVLLGEWGGRGVGLDSVEGRWQRQLMDYLGRTWISWTYWALNPNSGDTGGVLRDDWRSVDAGKLRLLQRLIRRQRIPFGEVAVASAARLGDEAPATDGAVPAPPGQSDRGPAEQSGGAPADEAPPDGGAPPADGDRSRDGQGSASTSSPAERTGPSPTSALAGPAAPGVRRPAPRKPTLAGLARPAAGRVAPAPVGRGPAGPAAPSRRRTDIAIPTAPGPPLAGVTLSMVIDSGWAAGWCGHVQVAPRAEVGLGGRRVALSLPAGTRLTQSWNGALQPAGGDVALELPDWARAAPDAPYTATGLCVAGSGEAARLALR